MPAFNGLYRTLCKCQKNVGAQYRNCIGSEVAGGCEDCEVSTRAT